MASVVPYLFFAAIPVAGYAAYRNYQANQQRKELLFTWANNSGYQYAVEDDSMCERWNGDPFDEGDHRRAQNVITGTAKAPFSAFDYSYQTHTSDGRGGRTTTTHHYYVTALQLPGFLPTLQVTPENVLTRMGHALGLDDIDLESEDFNRKFRVHASDRKFASDCLTPRTMQALLARPAACWRINGTDILTWTEGRMSPSSVLEDLSTLQLVIDGIPSFVWKDHQA
jgi:Protein of unknown function (DUF3137)